MKIPFSYQTFSALFPDETTAIAYYTEQHSTYCPDCNIRLTRPLRQRNPLLLRCPQCGKAVSVFTGTVLQGTRTDLRYWLYTGMLFYFCKSHFPQFQLPHLLSIKSIKQEVGATSDQTMRRIYTTLRQLFDSTDEDDINFRNLIFQPLYLRSQQLRPFSLTYTGCNRSLNSLFSLSTPAE